MARAAVKAKQQQRAKAQPARARRRGHSGGGNPNQDLFFMKLRRHAKWAYVVLAVLFAATFALVGVGSGTNSGLSGLFTGLFGGSSSGKSVAAAQAEIRKHEPKGYLDLARAYEGKGQTASAISALQAYVGARPKDGAAWTELGGLQLNEGSKFASRYQQAQQAAQQANPGQAFLPSGTLGQALGTNPIDQLSTQRSSTLLTQYSQETSTEYGAALQSFQKAATLRPHDPQAQYNVAQAAQTVGQYQVELGALKRYLRLDPTSPQRSQIQSLIKQLEKQLHPRPSHG